MDPTSFDTTHSYSPASTLSNEWISREASDPCDTILYFLSGDKCFLSFFQATSNGAEPAISHSNTATDPLTASTESNSFLKDGGSKGEQL